MTLLYLTQGADIVDDDEILHGDGTGGELAVHATRPGILTIDIEGGALESGNAVLTVDQVRELYKALGKWLADPFAPVEE